MKKIILIIAATALLCSCSQDKNKLLSSKTWQCTRVDDTYKDGDIEGYLKQCISDGTIKEEHKEITNENTIALNFLADIQDGGISSDFIFHIDSSFTCDNNRALQGFEYKWGIKNDDLILSTGEKTKKWGRIRGRTIRLAIETLNDKELVLSKKILDIEVKVYFSAQ